MAWGEEGPYGEVGSSDHLPQTGDLVPTGATADVLDELSLVNVLNGCLGCGGDHEWRRDDAVVTVISEG